MRLLFKEIRFLLAISLVCTLACKKEPAPPTDLPIEKPFTQLPAAFTGVDFNNQLEYTEEYNAYTFRNFYNGAGVGIGDINRDGLPDLFFCGNLVDNKLYLNKGEFSIRRYYCQSRNRFQRRLEYRRKLCRC